MITKILLTNFLVLSAFNSYAVIDKSGGAKAASSKAEFCEKIKDPDYAKSLLYTRANHNVNYNQGGLFNGGVCWWYSLLLRNVANLAVYRPDLPRPDEAEIKELINDLIVAKGVVEIPGYENFQQFSYQQDDEIQAALNVWQITDGGLMFGWVRGISGETSVDAKALKKMMDDTYKIVSEKKQIAYQKLQIPGIDSHAWLVVDMIKNNKGYTLEVADSNYPGKINSIKYVEGMTSLNDYGGLVPYTSRNSMSYQAYDVAQKDYCKRNLTSKEKRNNNNNQ